MWAINVPMINSILLEIRACMDCVCFSRFFESDLALQTTLYIKLSSARKCYKAMICVSVRIHRSRNCIWRRFRTSSKAVLR